MDSRLVSERVAQMEWIDAVAVPLQNAVERAYRSMGKFGERLERFMHGEFLGHPLHPVMVHLPVGAWILAALLDPWGGSAAARAGAHLAVALGVVGALTSAIPGATDYYSFKDPKIRRLGGLHAILNWTAILLYGLSWIERSRGSLDFARVLSYLGFAAVGVSGYLGGLMVYEKRIGVNHAPLDEEQGEGAENWVPVARLADLPDGLAYQASAGDLDLVLVRRGETVDALANRCSHQGGPLSEGLVADGCIECPWHATRFALATGQSVGGPGVYAQPRYRTRVVDGTVEVAAPAMESAVEAEALGGQASLM